MSQSIHRSERRAPVLTSISDPSDRAWNDAVEVVSSRDHPGWASWLGQVLRRSRGRRAFILRGTSGWSEGYRELVAVGLLSRLHRGATVVVSDATMEPGSRKLAERLPRVLKGAPVALSRWMVRFASGRNVRWCVLSRAETETFARVWGLADPDVVFTPFTHTIYDRKLLQDVPTGDYFFSGGNSLRDYEVLVEAARGVPADVRVASSWVPAAPAGRVRFGATSHREFLTAMRESLAVVLPLEAAVRSTGQQTYLNAMALGKVVIVSDVAGVRDHVEDGVTGLVVRDAAAMRAAMLEVLDPTQQARFAAMGRAARAAVLGGMTSDDYRRRLLRLAGV